MLGDRLSSWLWGTFIATVAVGALSIGVFYLLGTPYPLLLGTLVGITNVVPLVGPWIGGAVAIIVTLLLQSGLALWVAVAVLGIQEVESNLIRPFVMKGVAKLHPFPTLLALILFTSMFGVLGAVLSLPLLIAIGTIVEVLCGSRRRWTSARTRSATSSSREHWRYGPSPESSLSSRSVTGAAGRPRHRPDWRPMIADNPPVAAAHGSAVEVPAVARAAPRVRVRAFYDLTKPGITRMVLVTTAAGFYLASPGGLDLLLLFHALVGTTLASSGCNALNQVVERDCDARMRRTARRPLPSGRLTHGEALVFATAMANAGLFYLLFFVNGLTAALVALRSPPTYSRIPR
jgi:hypothetical protein